MSGKFDMVNNDCYRAACEIGADFYRAIQICDCEDVPRNLLGYTGKLEVRASPTEAVIFAPTVEVDEDMGLVTATAASSVTEDLPAGMYYYDWIITSSPPDGAKVERILEGRFQITTRITV